VKIKNGKLQYKDNLVEVLDISFNSFDLVVNNTNYSPEYLKSVYIIEFYKILEGIEKRLKAKNGS